MEGPYFPHLGRAFGDVSIWRGRSQVLEIEIRSRNLKSISDLLE